MFINNQHILLKTSKSGGKGAFKRLKSIILPNQNFKRYLDRNREKHYRQKEEQNDRYIDQVLCSFATENDNNAPF